ncbi:hypothetical protein [Corallococcus carmarthensis]|uniref:Uncharacterized protein n=1 Tax=Corallococcus carmarthensis TaxID=2316728 RepID=A0A3A8KZ56_9BACT|nr:hypothetical protein [Corallococcus carmarthensis]NOK17500.1 hypothetical protein [Corallococcus carmarthensis]RKH07532.1 hypothetical protein D7X32_01865 [Corallococcus carmarthensis]
MALIPLYKPQDLVKKAATQAVFPALMVAPPPSQQRSLVGLKRLMHDRNLDPKGLEATVYDTRGCVLSGALHEAADLSQNTHTITEPGTGVIFNGDHNLLALLVGGPVVAQSFNIYYLHWGFDSTHCVRLGADANYFVTAALQGCSIFVTGDPTSPTVYHLNANAAGANAPNDAARYQAKVQVMEARFNAARKVMGGNQQSSASASMLDYMPGMLSVAGTAQLEYDHGVSGTSWHHVGTHAFRSFWKVDQDELMQFGTVFGVRKEGRWSFYFQKRSRHEYRYKTWMSGSARHAEWTAECRRFWPA